MIKRLSKNLLFSALKGRCFRSYLLKSFQSINVAKRKLRLLIVCSRLKMLNAAHVAIEDPESEEVMPHSQRNVIVDCDNKIECMVTKTIRIIDSSKHSQSHLLHLIETENINQDSSLGTLPRTFFADKYKTCSQISICLIDIFTLQNDHPA